MAKLSSWTINYMFDQHYRNRQKIHKMGVGEMKRAKKCENVIEHTSIVIFQKVQCQMT